MDDSLESVALLIYNESLEWVIDYVEDEIDFQTTILNFENTTSRFYQDRIDLKEYLDDELYYILLNIESLFEQRVMTLYGTKVQYQLSEKDLKNELEFILQSA